jgi:hypothetical protein
MSTVDDLIAKFTAIKNELSKNVNMAYSPPTNSSPAPTPTTGTSGGQGGMYRSEDVKKDGMIGQDAMAMSECLKFDSNGQWKLNKVDPTENINVPHPQGKAKMANGVNKEEMSEKLGTNQRLANPPESAVGDPRGKKVHMIKDEGKFKVMDEVEEKESKKEKVAGLPYNGDDKKTHKSESADAKGYEEQRAQNKARFTYST